MDSIVCYLVLKIVHKLHLGLIIEQQINYLRPWG